LLPRHQDTDHFDLAIAWGDGNWTTLEFIPFIQIQVTPVLSPELKQPKSISDLFDYPLIHQGSRSTWRQWFQSAGIERDIDRTGMVIDDANLILQAALDGQGVALGILPFVQEEISNGRLVRPFELSIDSGQAYYLLYRKSMLEKPAVKTVRDWLVEQVRG
jgi:LysR family glycine cleavage system transcriptional activator